MSATSERLTQLQRELDALRQIQTQEDFDEGARLHIKHNAPWVSGQYAHLAPAVLNPPYVYKAFPAARYHVLYGPARKAWLEAHALSPTDPTRDQEIRETEQAMNRYVKRVENEAEAQTLGAAWFERPEQAEARRLADEHEIGVQAGHLAYENRNLTGKALEELELADSLSDGHLVDPTAVLEQHGKLQKRRGRPKKAEQPVEA